MSAACLETLGVLTKKSSKLQYAHSSLLQRESDVNFGGDRKEMRVRRSSLRNSIDMRDVQRQLEEEGIRKKEISKNLSTRIFESIKSSLEIQKCAQIACTDEMLSSLSTHLLHKGSSGGDLKKEKSNSKVIFDIFQRGLKDFEEEVERSLKRILKISRTALEQKFTEVDDVSNEGFKWNELLIGNTLLKRDELEERLRDSHSQMKCREQTISDARQCGMRTFTDVEARTKEKLDSHDTKQLQISMRMKEIMSLSRSSSSIHG